VSCDCGCCVAAEAQAEVENRPGLSAVAYRLGTFASFRKSILDRLSQTKELEGLRSRLSSDYAVTLVDLWSAVADVLTFYQERIANEAFLRTAARRDSLLRLVRLIDYELRAGAAATTQLAFTLEKGTKALIPATTRVQSVPAQGEQPQKYETLEPLAADARLNRLRIRSLPVLQQLPWMVPPLSIGAVEAPAAPDPFAVADVAALAPGDRVVAYAPPAVELLTVEQVVAEDDDLVVRWATPPEYTYFAVPDPESRAYKLGRSFNLFGYDAPEAVATSQLKNTADPTTAFLLQAKTDFSLDTTSNELALDRKYEGLKIGAVVLAVGSKSASPSNPNPVTTVPFRVNSVAEKLVKRNATAVSGSTTYTVPAVSGTVTVLELTPLGPKGLADLLPADGDIRNVHLYELVGNPLRFWGYAYPDRVETSEVVVSGRRAGWSAVETGRTIEKGKYKPGTVIDVADLPVGRPVLLVDGAGSEPVAGTIAGTSLLGSNLALSATDTDSATVEALGLSSDRALALTVIASESLGTTVILPNTHPELTVTIGDLPEQTIALDLVFATPPLIPLTDVAAALQAAIRAALPGAPTFAHALAWPVGDAVAISAGVPGDRVSFGPTANDPDTVSSLGLAPERARYLDGLLSAAVPQSGIAFAGGAIQIAIGIAPPSVVALPPVTVADAPALAAFLTAPLDVFTAVTDDRRVVLVPQFPEYEQRAFLAVALDLDTTPDLDAGTAFLLGNVAPASQGETIRNEILGDGDASQAFQRFKLKKKPVTYVPSATSGGAASSLRVMVDGVRWTEVPTLYGAGEHDPVYRTRIADDGTLTVQFGDGSQAARTPTGRQNLVATYRQGTGVAGRVGAAKLTTLLDRPTGVKAVTNPVAADGGADPETLARAREAAPGTVRTFGRAVSLRDFEDTALLAGEVAKACATWVWTGTRRAVHLTIAAQGGALFSPEGLKRITATLATERDPNQRLIVANYSPVAVLVGASLIVDDRYVTADVLAAARQALLDSLSFDRRSFAEPVYVSDVYAVLQGVKGVVAVEVERLDLKSSDSTFRADHGVDDALGQPQPHLLMLPARPSAGLGSPVLPAELARVESPPTDVTLRATGGIQS